MASNRFEIDVRLRNITPPIWRTLEMPSTATLSDLHYAIQLAMGWQNCHLHQFVIGKVTYGARNLDEDAPRELVEESSVTLQDVVKRGDRFVYEYDFGDGWEHDVEIKNVTPAKAPRPRCTAGARACPPEDCGGPPGYQQLVEALADRAHPDYERLVEWIGHFKPEAFDLPPGGRDLRDAMTELQMLAQAGAVDEHEESMPMNLPRPLVEAVLALDPIQRASLCALLAGSLADELLEERTLANHLLANGATRTHKPARSPARSKRR